MLYTSLVNWAALTAAVGVFWLLHGRARVVWFAAGSLLLLAMNDPVALGALAFVTVVATLAPPAHAAVRRWGPRGRGVLLLTGAAMYGAILLPLFVFKAPNGIMADLVGAPAVIRLAIPLGVSYFTVRAIMYVRAVTRNELPSQALDGLVCYLAFAPTASAGPIDTPRRFFEGLRCSGRLSSNQFLYAGARIVFGVILILR